MLSGAWAIKQRSGGCALGVGRAGNGQSRGASEQPGEVCGDQQGTDRRGKFSPTLSKELTGDDGSPGRPKNR